MGISIGQPAPDFTADAVIGKGDFKQVKLSDITKSGKWAVLYFYPLDFTFVCPTEIRAFDEFASKFESTGAQVIGCSIDSKFSHKGWLATGGITKDNTLRHPVMADLTKHISRDYGVLDEAKGIAMRGTIIIDPKGNVRSYSVCDAPVGRNVDETLRTLMALQHADKSGGKEVCPVNWKPGTDAIKLG